MQAGKLRNFVTIQQPVKVASDIGSVETTWEEIANVYAGIEQMKAFDQAQASVVFPGADYTITMRYRNDLDTTMRIVYRDQVFSILGPPNNVDLRNREIVLTCQSGVKES